MGVTFFMTIVRRQIILKGILQGIGFRPTVYRLATRHELAGWVINTTEAVRIEIEGTSCQCESFISELPGATPPPGQIQAFEILEKDPTGETSFRIQTSLETQREITPIPPDVAVCPECVSELFDPSDRRYLFPFVTCTLCGPRFTVVRSFPYDRERTSMADFEMCEDCATEYRDPDNRRFHSQTNSCPNCGPKLSLVDSTGKVVRGDSIIECIRLLKLGQIVAIKGLGGFHLAVDARNNDAVQRLRALKGRPEKPFAVMSRDIEEARKYCEISFIEAGTPAVKRCANSFTQGPWGKTRPKCRPFRGHVGSDASLCPGSPSAVQTPLFRRQGWPFHFGNDFRQ